MIRRLWRGLKTWRRVRLGPVALVFKLDRAVRVTHGTLKRSGTSHVGRVDVLGHGPNQSLASLQVAPDQPPRSPELAVIVGAGPGFGHSLAGLLAAEGFDLALVSRDADRLSALVSELHAYGVTVASYGADATDESAVAQAFDRITQVHGVPALVIYSLQYSGPGTAVDIEVPAFESAWRHNCLGAFLVSRRAAQLMLGVGRGTIVFVGSTSSLIGRAGHLNLAVGKFGQRALAQVMARELWPRGIHVVHAVVDADIAEDPLQAATTPQSDPSHIAAAILALHRQPKTAWTSELDLRPWNERFWEHC